MIHTAKEMIRVEQDLVAPLALDVCHEADAAAVVLELRPIEAVSRRQAVSSFVSHIRRSSCAPKSVDGSIWGRTPSQTIETRFP
jgi:hypothetical protein